MFAGSIATAGFGMAALLVGRGSAVPNGRLAEFAAPADRPLDSWGVAAGSPRMGSALLGLTSELTSRHAAAAMAAAVLCSVAVGSLAPIVVTALLIGLVVTVIRQRQHSRRLQFDAGLPDLVDAMAAAVRAGAVPAVALVEASRGAAPLIREDVGRVAVRIGRGERFAESMMWWAADRRLATLDLLAAVMSTSNEFGGPLASVLDDVADQLRHDLRTRDDVRTHSAQAVASAAMLILLPLVSTAITAIADPGVLRVLFATPIGAVCLAVGVALEAIAAWWMVVIVRGVR